MGNFQSKWTESNIPDLSGKVFLVTGANSGLGEYTAGALGEKNATVIMGCRSKSRGEDARQRIINRIYRSLLKSGSKPVKEEIESRIHLYLVDLSDISSIKEFAKNIKKDFSQLNVLVNNAGGCFPYFKTADGFDSSFGVNHLGTFAVTRCLFDLILSTSQKSNEKCRIVQVSSIAHKYGKLDFDNLMPPEKEYDQGMAYNNAKLSNLYFTYELQRKVEEKAYDNIMSVAAHPG